MKLDLQALSQPCSCGHTHGLLVREILIESGALARLPELLSRLGDRPFCHPAVVCDAHTYRAAGARVEALLPGCQVIRLEWAGLHADERAVQTVESELRPQVDLLLAVGSGTLTDITRYVAKARALPFVSVPTAPSVDGFVSTVAAMTWGGFKLSLEGVAPIAVVADTEVFGRAPYRLVASGISDLLAKHICLADWRIAHLVTGEYLCERVCALEEQALAEVTQNLDRIRAGRPEAMETLMYALLLSGLAMQMVGNSRPASGAEHHISHLWEMEMINPPVEAYHGEKVSVGFVMCARRYHQLAQAIYANRVSLGAYQAFDPEMFRPYARTEGQFEALARENRPDPLLAVDRQRLLRQLPQIADIIERIPAPKRVAQMLKEGGCVQSMQQIGMDPGLLEETVRLAPYVRKRLTLLRLMKLLSVSGD